MRNARSATEPEVVLAFLRGELRSPRFGDAVLEALEEVGGRALVTTPDLTSDRENIARREALTRARGWGADFGLFAGFPADVEWSHGVLGPDELERVRYINYSYWIELSGGSRRPGEVSRMLRSGNLPPWLQEMGTDWLFEFAADLRQDQLGDLIIVGTPTCDRLVVLEGHARLTALFIAGLEGDVDVHAYLGVSPTIARWELF